MLRETNFYIDGEWVAPTTPKNYEVINPANEAPFGVISLGSKSDVDKAVAAATKAFQTWSTVPHKERIEKLKLLAKIYDSRAYEMAEAISMEMGAPIKLAVKSQTAAGLGHINAFIRALEEFKFENQLRDDTPDEYIIYEPIGVCGLITPWNWPMNQVTLKVVPAIGVGCTVILKPSEIAPMSSLLFAEFMDKEFPPILILMNINGCLVHRT